MPHSSLVQDAAVTQAASNQCSECRVRHGRSETKDPKIGGSTFREDTTNDVSYLGRFREPKRGHLFIAHKIRKQFASCSCFSCCLLSSFRPLLFLPSPLSPINQSIVPSRTAATQRHRNGTLQRYVSRGVCIAVCARLALLRFRVKFDVMLLALHLAHLSPYCD